MSLIEIELSSIDEERHAFSQKPQILSPRTGNESKNFRLQKTRIQQVRN